jgi:type I restriction enzyme S subunit
MNDRISIKKLLDGVEVEWKTLGEVAIKVSSGGTPKTNISEYYGGVIPWLRTQEVNFCDILDTSIKITNEGLKNSSAKLIPANCVIIAMYGATVGKIGINKIPLSTNQACANIQLNDKIANYRYVFYYLTSQYKYIKSLGFGPQTNINAQIVKKLQIPIPPLNIQKEIVRILDSFTELTIGLTTELTERKKQYEYYENKLLFNTNYKKFIFKDICTVNQGFQIPISQRKIEHGVNRYFYITVQFLKSNKEKYYIENPKESVICHVDDILVTRTGSTGKIITGVKGCFHNNFFKVNCFEKVNKRYVYYVLNSKKMYAKMMQVASGGAVPDLTHNSFYKLEILIPSLAEQKRIVAILDKFDTLTNSINERLPKEIDLRKKQYEYYRDMLLTFPKGEKND